MANSKRLKKLAIRHVPSRGEGRIAREALDAAARSWHISTGSPTEIPEGPVCQRPFVAVARLHLA